MIIAPEEDHKNFNHVRSTVKTILFDGANSRLLVNPKGSEKEVLVALPQNRQFDYIQPGDIIEIGWDIHSGSCFPADDNGSPPC